MIVPDPEFPSSQNVFEVLPAALMTYNTETNRLKSLNNKLTELLGCHDIWKSGLSLYSLRCMFEYFELRKILVQLKNIKSGETTNPLEFSIRIKTVHLQQRWLNFRIDADMFSEKNSPLLGQRIFVISIYDTTTAHVTDRTNVILSRLNSLNENRRRNRGVKAVLDRFENEREELAYELHEELGVNLSHIKYGLQTMQDLDSETDKALRENIISELTAICNKSISKIRKIHDNLAPAGLKEFGLEVIIRRVIDVEFKHSETVAHLDSNLGKIRFNDFIELNYYRMALELIDNASKFSKAKNLYVILRYEFNRLTLLVADDGIGFNPNKINESGGKLIRSKGGNGLTNIRERCKILNCTFTIFAARDEGCRVTIEKEIRNLL